MIHSEIQKRILILDGAMGTVISEYGLGEQDFRKGWFEQVPGQLKGNNDVLCLTRPDVISDIHERYLKAGADIKALDENTEKEAREKIRSSFIEAAKNAFYEYQSAKEKAIKAGKSADSIKGTPLERDTIIRVNIDPERDRWIVCEMVDVLGRYYNSMNQALLAYENQEITLHQPINVYREKVMPDGSKVSGMIKTTLGRLIFNEILPQDLGFVDRENRIC